ncbi:MAG: hypothetical protein JW717_09075 [Marinilabiliaceae bacterium]|nr:hypothetical protein [Marinilabiliaceae bacterium]
MNYRYLFLIILIVSIITRCENYEEETTIKANDFRLVTGLLCRQSIEDAGFVVGNPNDWSNFTLPDPVPDNSVISIAPGNSFNTYSNPFHSTLIIINDFDIESIWIVKGVVSSQYQSENFDQLFKTTPIDTTGMNKISCKRYNFNDSLYTHFALDLSELENGFYKIIVKDKSSNMLWRTVYKTDNEYIEPDDFSFWK